MDLEVWEKIIIPFVLTAIGIIIKLFLNYIHSIKRDRPSAENIVISPNISPIISVGKDTTETEEQEKNLSDSASFEIIREEVQKNLKKIKGNFSCDRVWIGKFHNGKDNESYQLESHHWQLFSLVEAIEHLGVAKMKFYLRHIPTVFYKEIFSHIIREDYIFIQDTHETGVPMSYFFQNHGIKSTLMIGLFDNAKNLKGILGLDTINRSLHPPQQENIEYLQKYGDKIVNVLPTYIIRKDQ